MPHFELKSAAKQDVPLILTFIKELAEYEKLAHVVTATEAILEESLFGPKSHVEVLLGYLDGLPVAFAIYFHNFSGFKGRSGIYVEDLYVRPEARGAGIGQKMLAHLAKLARERNCIRLEWAVFDWNESAIGFYKRLGAVAMDDLRVFRLADEALDKLAVTSI